MSKPKEVLIWFVSAVVYLVAAFYWEVAIAKITLWWGEQFIIIRPTLTNHQSIYAMAIAVFFALVVIPQFMWMPVIFFKELRWVVNNLSEEPVRT